MTLRIMLVGLVASLGFDTSSVPDVSRWAQACAGWAGSRGDDRSGPEAGPAPALERPTDCQQVDLPSDGPPTLAASGEVASDAPFRAASDAMAADFSADLLAGHRQEAPGQAAVLLAATEPPARVGLPEGEEAVASVVPAEEAGPAVVATTPSDDPCESTAPLESSGRLAEAVRLTREAVQAWAGLMQSPAEDGQPSR